MCVLTGGDPANDVFGTVLRSSTNRWSRSCAISSKSQSRSRRPNFNFSRRLTRNSCKYLTQMQRYLKGDEYYFDCLQMRRHLEISIVRNRKLPFFCFALYQNHHQGHNMTHPEQSFISIYENRNEFSQSKVNRTNKFKMCCIFFTMRLKSTFNQALRLANKQCALLNYYLI